MSILDIEPISISSNPKDYSMFIYGPPNVGKTTFVRDLFGKKVLFIATEKRHGAVEGSMVKYIENWSEFLAVIAELNSNKAREMYDAVCIDTAFNLWLYLEEYVKKQLDITEFGKIQWGKDWNLLKQYWRNAILKIERFGYLPIFIAHSKKVAYEYPASIIEKLSDDEVSKIENKNGVITIFKNEPDLSNMAKTPILRMVDNILFMNNAETITGEDNRTIQLRDDLFAKAGFTFEHSPNRIPLNAQSYIEAIEKSVSMVDEEYVSDELAEYGLTQPEEIVFEDLMDEVNDIAKKLFKMEKFNAVKEITEYHLGEGARVSALTERDKIMLLIVRNDLKERYEEERNNLVTEGDL